MFLHPGPFMFVTPWLAATLLLSPPAPGTTSPATEDGTEVAVALGTIPESLALSPAKKFKAADRLPLRVRWSSDGTVAAYVGYRGTDGSESVPVLHRSGEDATVGEAYDFIDPPVVAKNAPHVAFRVGKTRSKKKERWWVWLDGKPVHQEDWIGAVALSPDGQRVAYWAQPGAELEEGGAYARKPMVLRAPGKKKVRKPKKWEDSRALQAPVFSDDSKKVFGLGMENGRWFAVGKGRKSFEALGSGHAYAGHLQVAKGGKALAFSALAEERVNGTIQQGQRVIKDGEIVPTSHVRTGYPALSRDGKRVAQKYVSFSMTMGIVIEEGLGKEPGFDYVGRPVWDPKGSRVAFASVTDAGGVDRDALTHKGEMEPREGDWRLTQWTRKGKAMTSSESWERVRNPVYSESGDMVTARVLDDEGWRVVVLDLAGKVLVQGPAHMEVGSPRFAADARSVTYGARDDRTLSSVTMSIP